MGLGSSAMEGVEGSMEEVPAQNKKVDESRLGLAKIRVRVNLGLDKLDIRTKTSYLDLVRIINRTL